jgi:hypothetical protein
MSYRYIKKTIDENYINPHVQTKLEEIRQCLKDNTPLSSELNRWLTVKHWQSVKGRLNPKIRKQLESLDVELVSSIKILWEKYFEGYKLLKSENPNFIPKTRVAYALTINGKEESLKFTGWIGYQRLAYKEGKLSQERIDKLNSIGFQWTLNSSNHQFYNYKQYLQLAIEFRSNFGRLPKKSEQYKGKDLGWWVFLIKRYTRDYVVHHEKCRELSQENLDLVKPLFPYLFPKQYRNAVECVKTPVSLSHE